MAMLVTRTVQETLLSVKEEEEGSVVSNHILEPEYHQERYVEACESVKALKGAFQLVNASGLVFGPSRGGQPTYADNEDDPASLEFGGMVAADGSVIKDEKGNKNVCALKSNCVRRGYVDFSLARSVSREFFKKRESAAGVKRNDVLINSTGDGTIGRVAVFDANFPAVVDGHITILRFDDEDFAWYVAAFLLSDVGQRQIYRYINGSSGQVEIYPQDIGRIWIKPPQSDTHIAEVSKAFKSAAALHASFYRELQAALATV